MDREDQRLREIWKQRKIPTVYRQGGKKPVFVRLPEGRDAYGFLKGDHRMHPQYNLKYGCWEIPRAWFEDIVKRSLTCFRSVYVIQPFYAEQKCAPSCWNAVGLTCECSCMGANHGSGEPDGKWYVVSESCAVQHEGRQYACKLIKSWEKKGPDSTAGMTNPSSTCP